MFPPRAAAAEDRGKAATPSWPHRGDCVRQERFDASSRPLPSRVSSVSHVLRPSRPCTTCEDAGSRPTTVGHLTPAATQPSANPSGNPVKPPDLGEPPAHGKHPRPRMTRGPGVLSCPGLPARADRLEIYGPLRPPSAHHRLGSGSAAGRQGSQICPPSGGSHTADVSSTQPGWWQYSQRASGPCLCFTHRRQVTAADSGSHVAGDMPAAVWRSHFLSHSASPMPRSCQSPGVPGPAQRTRCQSGASTARWRALSPAPSSLRRVAGPVRRGCVPASGHVVADPIAGLCESAPDGGDPAESLGHRPPSLAAGPRASVRACFCHASPGSQSNDLCMDLWTI